ncbi:DUF1566 domain-containing protein [Thalassolituus sp. LLYu03]|uniref:Lcl domain-containing protein n=1 Tax=Thalassolituus sp. LLYu03 TaxID=3421656 RepID=UPI003D274F28
MAYELNKQLMVALLAATLAACGGGSGGSSSDNTGGDTSGGDTSGGNNSGGDTSGGNNSGGDTSGGDTSGGNNSGGDTSGGDNSGGDTSGGDGTDEEPRQNLAISAQPHAEGVVLNWLAVTGATSYTVYMDNSAIDADSPATSRQNVSCSASPCRVVTPNNGLQHVLVVAEGTAYQSDDLAVVAGAMNDTGYDKCFGTVNSLGSNSADCATAPAAAGQDGVNGRDANTALVKVGAGPKGFDFTKLDVNGNEVANSATAWRCVRDNVTGRTWEVKQTDTTIALNDDFTDDASLYDGRRTFNFAGDAAYLATGQVADVAFSGSVDYLINQANNDQLCGKTDWRLPSQQEMLSILDMSAVDVSTSTYPQLGAFEIKSTEAIGSSGGYETFINSGYLTATQVLGNSDAIHIIDARNKYISAAFKTGGQQLGTTAKDSSCIKPTSSSGSCVYAGHFARLVSY